MRIYLLLLTVIGTALSALASDTTGYNRIYFSAAPQYYLNKVNVDNDNELPNPIQAKNTFGYALAASFERTTRRGIVFDAGLQLGIRKHNINLHSNLSDYDSRAVINLKDKTIDEQIPITLPYISPRLLVGYKLHLHNGWAATAKGGVSITYFLKEDFRILKNTTLNYYTDDYVSERVAVPVKVTSIEFRQVKRSSPTRWGHNMLNRLLFSGQLYIGAEKQLNTRYIKSITAGLELSGAMIQTFRNEYNTITTVSYRSWDAYNKMLPPMSDLNSQDSYTDKNVSIGLRMGVGLWK